MELVSIGGPTRVGTPEDEGRAIPRNVMVGKHGDDGESPKNRSQNSISKQHETLYSVTVIPGVFFEEGTEFKKKVIIVTISVF
jgi:hypothetical protein